MSAIGSVQGKRRLPGKWMCNLAATGRRFGAIYSLHLQIKNYVRRLLGGVTVELHQFLISAQIKARVTFTLQKR
jgi:hypothetical protein